MDERTNLARKSRQISAIIGFDKTIIEIDIAMVQKNFADINGQRFFALIGWQAIR